MLPYDHPGASGREGGGTNGRRTRLRAMVVEDQVLIALALSADLAALGCEVVARTESGERAVEVARRLAPDLVLMDVHLAGAMDGIEAAKRIRAATGCQIVFVSAFAEGPERTQMAAARPAAILTKPYDPDELEAIVDRLAAMRGRAEFRAAAEAAD